MLRNLLAYLFALVLLLLLYFPALVVSGLFRNERFLYALARRACRAVLRIVGVRTRVHGLAQADFSRPMVMVCNHLSNLDGPLLYGALPCNARALVKAEARKLPLIGSMLKLAGFVFVDRENPAQRQEALAAAVEKIRTRQYSFLVFPEGTRSRDGFVQNFKKGGFKIALAAGVPVLPIRISGSHPLLPPGRVLVKPGTVDIEVFAPLSVSGLQEGDLAELVRDLQQKTYQEKTHENH